jgi:hypothetical protein
MNEAISELKKKLSFLDCSQNNIQKTSEEFINNVLSDETVMEDLVKLWKFYILNKQEKLAFIFLANDIIQNSFFRGLKFHEVFFNHLIEVFPLLYNSLNEKLRREIFRVLDIWEERKIYDSAKLENLRQLLSVTTIPASNTLDNPLFQNFVRTNKVRISDKIKEFAQNLEEFNKIEEKIKKFQEDGLAQSTDVNKLEESLNKSRGKFLQNSADTIKKQNQVYFKHVYYLQEVEKMMDKIESYKKVYEKTVEVQVEK